MVGLLLAKCFSLKSSVTRDENTNQRRQREEEKASKGCETYKESTAPN